MADPISTTPDMHEGYPEEWETLERSGTGDNIRVVEWDAVSGRVRMSGPVVLSQPPIARAP